MSAKRASLRSLAVASLLAIGLVAGCGGLGGAFDTFQPRPATISDLEGQTFDFTWMPTTNPLDSELGPMTLVFGALDDAGRVRFTIYRHGGGTSGGNVTLASPTLTFAVTTSTGDTPLTVGENLSVTVEADTDDGRIRLTNPVTKAETTSDPR